MLDFTHVVRILLLPPGCLLLLLLAGLLLARRRPRAGKALLVTATALLYLLSTPPVARFLIGSLEVAPALTLEQVTTCGAQAIVVLGGGYVSDPPEYGHPIPAEPSLARLRYGAYLARHTGLPLMLVSGGGTGGEDSEAAALARVARDDFGIKSPIWVEDRSLTTHENAEMSAPLLRAQGVSKIILVTQAWHIRRARRAYERLGMEVVPGPTMLEHPGRWDNGIFVILPDSFALWRSSRALEEWLGVLYYRLRW